MNALDFLRDSSIASPGRRYKVVVSNDRATLLTEAEDLAQLLAQLAVYMRKQDICKLLVPTGTNNWIMNSNMQLQPPSQPALQST